MIFDQGQKSVTRPWTLPFLKPNLFHFSKRRNSKKSLREITFHKNALFNWQQRKVFIVLKVSWGATCTVQVMWIKLCKHWLNTGLLEPLLANRFWVSEKFGSFRIKTCKSRCWYALFQRWWGYVCCSVGVLKYISKSIWVFFRFWLALNKVEHFEVPFQYNFSTWHDWMRRISLCRWPNLHSDIK